MVVCLQDVHTLHTFLQTSQTIFRVGLCKSTVDWLGFVSISGTLVAPFVAKTDPLTTLTRRYVPQSLIVQKVLLDKVHRVQMDEWDASYIRMLLIYAGLEHVNLLPEEQLCCLDDLQWDSSYCPLRIEDVTPGPRLGSESTLKAVRNTLHSAPGSSFDSLDDSWMRSSTASSPNTTLRSLHQVMHADVAGMHLKAINLKPYSNQQAVFVGDVVSRICRGVPLLTVLHILGQILQVKLYECTRYVPLNSILITLTHVYSGHAQTARRRIRAFWLRASTRRQADPNRCAEKGSAPAEAGHTGRTGSWRRTVLAPLMLHLRLNSTVYAAASPIVHIILWTIGPIGARPATPHIHSHHIFCEDDGALQLPNCDFI